MTNTATLISRFTTYIIDPAILIVFAAGFFLFIWGLVQFLNNVEGDRNEGKQHMIWGIVGMFVMVSVFGIITMLDNTFNLGIFGGGPDPNAAAGINTTGTFF
jgi:hypothetical protein